MQLGGVSSDGRNLGRRGILIERMRRVWGDPVQDGDGEAIFVLPASRLLEAAQVVKAYQKRQFSPEQARANAERLGPFLKAKVPTPA